MKNGIYSYKFSGDGIKKMIPFRILGVGTFELDADNVKDGYHRSTLLDLVGSAPVYRHSVFHFDGKITEDQKERNWSASLKFVQQDPDAGERAQVFNGRYRFVFAGADRYWIISTGANTSESGTEVQANEAVLGEIVWTGT